MARNSSKKRIVLILGAATTVALMATAYAKFGTNLPFANNAHSFIKVADTPLRSDYSSLEPLIGGYDPVSYFNETGPIKGSKSLYKIHQGNMYTFANPENLKMFSAAPEKYLPQYGGNCALGMSYGKPSKVDPTIWKVVDGKLYLLLNAGTKKSWEKKLPKHINKADTNWNKVIDG